LTVDTLTALVHEHARVTGAGVKFGDCVGDDYPTRVEPWARTDPVSRVSRLVAVRRVAFDAQIGAPRAPALPDCCRQPLTRRVCPSKPTEIARHTNRAADEEVERRTGRRGRAFVITATRADDDNE
jgi:hypothetical protein